MAYAQNDFKLFQTVSERLVHAYPGRPDGYHGFGVLAWTQGSYQQARGWFIKALAQDKGYAPSLAMLKKFPSHAGEQQENTRELQAK